MKLNEKKSEKKKRRVKMVKEEKEKTNDGKEEGKERPYGNVKEKKKKSYIWISDKQKEKKSALEIRLHVFSLLFSALFSFTSPLSFIGQKMVVVVVVAVGNNGGADVLGCRYCC